MNSLSEPYRRDPAVSFLMLLPLALLHLSGYSVANLEAVSMVEVFLQPWQPYAMWAIVSCLVVSVLWSIGRISQLELAWRGGAMLILAESLFWAVVLGPILGWLKSIVEIELLPLGSPLDIAEKLSLHAKLAIAAGAGLYEELIFRVLLLGGLAILLRGLFLNFFSDAVARKLGMVLALVSSAIVFAAAHGATGDSSALETGPLVYRSLAGIAFGLLYWFRGLAVCAYAHAAYDAILLLKFV
ncbi:MAG: CPBP family intramembrane metalloprotease [Planctomycetes bacterium]|nr:CPBP family intramembrane metalloprotease [Planctomycetota bacterium]